MDLRNIRQINQLAPQRLMEAPVQKKIILIYAALALGLTAVTTVANFVLGLQMDNFGGLSNLGKKTMLSTIQSMLPMVQALLSMCISVGYVAAMLRIARGMYTSPQTLRLGFDRFWVLLRCTIFKGLIMSGILFGCLYLGVLIYLLTPLSNAAVEVVQPLISQSSLLDPNILIDDATYALLLQALMPAFVIWGILVLVIGGPVFYSFRMVNYVIIDKPGMGAMAALAESKRMMRGNRRQLLKLDFSLWWYYLALAAVMALCYGDVLLPMAGITLPVSQNVAFFGFYALYLAASFALFYFLRNRVEVSYALAYESVRPKEQQEGGVVLGNIFQM